eukprot:2797273-Prymnesium_polylepis.1
MAAHELGEGAEGLQPQRAIDGGRGVCEQLERRLDDTEAQQRVLPPRGKGRATAARGLNDYH